MMEMPTPCPNCGDVVELNDMNPCGSCNECYCKNCLDQPFMDCENCKTDDQEEE